MTDHSFQPPVEQSPEGSLTLVLAGIFAILMFAIVALAVSKGLDSSIAVLRHFR